MGGWLMVKFKIGTPLFCMITIFAHTIGFNLTFWKYRSTGDQRKQFPE